MVDVGPGRWRIVQLVVYLLVGTALMIADVWAPAIGIGADDPLLFAVGTVFVGYALFAAAWEGVLALTDLAGGHSRE